MLLNLEREKAKRELPELINAGFDEMTTTLAFLLDLMMRNDYDK